MKTETQIMKRISYLNGIIEGITLYAIWKNGEQLIGCLQTPLKNVLKPYEDELIKLQEELNSIIISK